MCRPQLIVEAIALKSVEFYDALEKEQKVTKSVVVTEDLRRAFAQLNEVQKRLLNGALRPLDVRDPLQAIIEGRMIVLDRFALFSELLLSPADQLERLRAYDEKYWGGAICEELKGFQLPDVGLHPQRVKDLRVLHVEFGSPGETLERWWQVISATQPGSWRSGDLQSDSAHLGLHSQARHYPPGIHVVRLDLAAHWEPEAGRTLVDVYARVREAGEKLAHGEILSACGLHPDLVREMDGENLPFVDLAGYQVLMPGLPTCRAVPCLYWDSLRGKVALDVDSIDYFLPSWAAPVLRE